MRSSSCWSAGALSLLTLAAVAACSSGTPIVAGTTPPSAPAPEGPAPLKGMRLPVEDYMPSPWEIHEEAVARNGLHTACLKRYGITNSVSKPVFHGPKTLLERRYGSSDLAWAAKYAKYGFWMPGGDQAQRPEVRWLLADTEFDGDLMGCVFRAPQDDPRAKRRVRAVFVRRAQRVSWDRPSPLSTRSPWRRGPGCCVE